MARTRGKRAEKKTALVSVQMAPSMKQEIEALALAAEVSVGHWCRAAFKSHMARTDAVERAVA
jgi:hypothetical protein